MINGVELYKHGDDLKNGLIDIDKVYELVIEKETAKDQFIKPIGVTRQQKWKKVMQFMSTNPSFLLDTLPSAPP